MGKSGKRSSKSERLDSTAYFAMSFLVDVSMVKKSLSIQTNACGVRVISVWLTKGYTYIQACVCVWVCGGARVLVCVTLTNKKQARFGRKFTTHSLSFCLFMGTTFTHIHCFPVLPVVPSITVAVLPIKRTVSLKLASLLLLHIAVSAIIAVVSSYILRCLFSCLTVNLGRIFSKNAWHVNSFIC